MDEIYGRVAEGEQKMRKEDDKEMTKAKKLLIVDDEEEMCENIKEFLEVRGFNVTTAIRGMDAVEIVKKEKFPVILCDIRMPVVDGIAVLKEAVRVQPESKVIMVTGYDDAESEKECKKMGAYGYIRKPPKLKELCEYLDKLYK